MKSEIVTILVVTRFSRILGLGLVNPNYITICSECMDDFFQHEVKNGSHEQGQMATGNYSHPIRRIWLSQESMAKISRCDLFVGEALDRCFACKEKKVLAFNINNWKSYLHGWLKLRVHAGI